MLKKASVFFITLIFIINLIVPKASAVGEPSLSAKSAILINAQTNEVVYEKNAYEKRGMASTTKIMTALIALEKGNLKKLITAKDEDVRIEGTSIGLKDGDKITLEILVQGMLLESGNDAANVTARAIGGSREKFVALMNKKAKEIGMNNTVFKNPSGLTEDGHCSTAFDMALLGSYAIKNAEFRSICSSDNVRVSYGNPEYQRLFKNHNKLLTTCEGVFGIKTGFTKASGRCLVSAAERNGVTLVAVTLSAPDDWNDHKKLYNYGFERVNSYKVDISVNDLEIAVVGSDNKTIKVKLAEELYYTSEYEKKTETTFYFDSFLYAGVKKGDVVGYVRVLSNDNVLLCESDLISTENAPVNFIEKETSFFEKIKNYFGIQNR